ncbi:hypothetical protein MNBD_CHLOROFLEXI01-1553 [hydrothermal vent metagenome]|uniref:Protein kinase domain-containing protein n=1 Tax=hydrothermal vent metagenome TaxID=652676 RepID=A0A3B0VV09_9ZZZZ
MQILASTGRRSEAIALYEECRQLLIDELGMSPTAKTTALSEQIKGGSLSLVTPVRQGIRGYELGDKLGEGAFGSVYKAYQKGVGREVAIKIIHAKYANQPRFIRRFEAEAQIVARLEYPHIVPLYDYWREADGAYLVMRWLRGGSLQTALEKELFDVETAVTLITQIAGALHTAHRQGIIQQATAKKAKDRFNDTLAFAEALHHAVNQSNGHAIIPLPQIITAVPETEIINPYKGLQAFQEQDAENFYGRQTLIDQLLARLSPSPSQGESLGGRGSLPGYR